MLSSEFIFGREFIFKVRENIFKDWEFIFKVREFIFEVRESRELDDMLDVCTNKFPSIDNIFPDNVGKNSIFLE